LQSIRFLNQLWEKSIVSQKDDTNLLRTQLLLIEDILKEAVPVYAELMDKEELTDKEVWLLKYIQDTFGTLLLTLTHAIHIHAYQNLSKSDDVPKDIVEKSFQVYKFLAELTGYIVSEDKEIRAVP